MQTRLDTLSLCAFLAVLSCVLWYSYALPVKCWASAIRRIILSATAVVALAAITFCVFVVLALLLGSMFLVLLFVAWFALVFFAFLLIVD